MKTSLTVVNDAIIAFGKSLQQLKISGTVLTEGISPEAPLDSRLLKHAGIGDWNLPSLRTMDLSLDYDCGVYIGNFDACPLLMTLSLSIRCMCDGKITKYCTGPVYPSQIWKLPHLRSLELHHISAMLFDFDSLDHMPVLESLYMTIYDSCRPTCATSAPRLLAYHSHHKSSDSTKGTVLENLKWKDHWSLPRLKELTLTGPPSWVFSFKWLESCPSLEYIWLGTRGDFQRLPLSSSSKNASILPAEAPTRSDPKVDLETAENSGFEQGMRPLVESKLQEITLEGPWVLSEHDLNKVLTVYAPNLLSLTVDRIHAVSAQEEKYWHGPQFLKIIIDAIGAGGRSGESKEEGFQPGRQLEGISSRYRSGSMEADILKLTYAPKYVLDQYREKGVLLIHFMHETLIRTADKIEGLTY